MVSTASCASSIALIERALGSRPLARLGEQLRGRRRERGDRRRRVHDLVREHADQVLPRLDLARLELAVDVLQRHDLEAAPADLELRREHVELQQRVVLGHLQQRGPARLEREDPLREVAAEAR